MQNHDSHAATDPFAGAPKAVPEADKTAPSSRPRKKPSAVSKLVRNGWLTRQHGGWPMATVPAIAGSAIGGFSWAQLLLGVAWLVAFLWFDTLTQWMKASIRVDRSGKRRYVLKRGKRYVPALVTYGIIAGLGAIWLIIIWPGVIWWGVAILPWFLISWLEMWRGQYQSFWARASAIIASCLLVPIAFSLGSHADEWSRMWVATAFITAYFIGTIPYVKTLIRERGHSGWLAFSLGYHVALTAATAMAWIFGYVSWWLVAAWVILTLRAWIYPEAARRLGKPLRPAVIGVSEFAFTAVVLIAALAN